MKKFRRSIIGLVLTCLGSPLLGSVAGCSAADSEKPQHDPVEGRKLKDDLLKNVSKSGKAKSSKGASTAEDRF